MLGSAQAPVAVTVCSQARKGEIEEIIQEHGIIATITVDPSQDENTIELETLLNKPATTVFEKTPNRNDPCSCSSGKKYKKCCGLNL